MTIGPLDPVTLIIEIATARHATLDISRVDDGGGQWYVNLEWTVWAGFTPSGERVTAEATIHGTGFTCTEACAVALRDLDSKGYTP